MCDHVRSSLKCRIGMSSLHRECDIAADKRLSANCSSVCFRKSRTCFSTIQCMGIPIGAQNVILDKKPHLLKISHFLLLVPTSGCSLENSSSTVEFFLNICHSHF